MERKIYKKLLEWKEKNSKLPYMLIGARQTGKTYILSEFCQKEFKKNIYINLDSMKNIAQIFEETIDPAEIIQALEIELEQSIEVEETIIFIDEIQTSEKAISSLKYFAEAKENYKIVCAGSLLGVKLNRFKSSFPVGKVFIDYLFPMDFEEFLLALDEKKLLDMIKKCYEQTKPMLSTMHEKAIKLYNQYLCIGGMPANITKFKQLNRDINQYENDNFSEMIITSYLADMAKYTQNTESIKNTKIYLSMPAQLGKENKKFKYSLVESSARSREYETSLDWLLSSNMVLKCNSVKRPESPLVAYQDIAFKLYLSDIGILRTMAKISTKEIIQDKNILYKGAMVENYVAQVLYAKDRQLFYWQLGNEYEVDFLRNIEGDIIPIEVKASDNITSKSLNYYIKRYNPKYAIRISKKNFGFENGIKSIPLYSIHLL